MATPRPSKVSANSVGTIRCVLIALLFVTAPLTLAAKSRRPSKPAAPKTPTADTRPVELAQTQAVAARSEEEKARVALAEAAAKRRREWEARPEVVAAASAVAADQKALDAASERVMASLRSRTEYREALKARDAAEANGRAFRGESSVPDSAGDDSAAPGPGSPGGGAASTPDAPTAAADSTDRVKVANDALAARTIVSQLEVDAMVNDIQASAAREKMKSDAAAYQAMRTGFEQTLKQDPAWAAARKALDAAITKSSAAGKKLEQAMAKASRG